MDPLHECFAEKVTLMLPWGGSGGGGGGGGGGCVVLLIIRVRGL